MRIIFVMCALLIIACSNNKTNGTVDQNTVDSTASYKCEHWVVGGHVRSSEITYSASSTYESDLTYEFKVCNVDNGNIGFEYTSWENGTKTISGKISEVTNFKIEAVTDPIVNRIETDCGQNYSIVGVNSDHFPYELIFNCDSVWSYNIIGKNKAKGSLFSQNIENSQKQFVVYIGIDGGVYELIRDSLNGLWREEIDVYSELNHPKNAFDISIAECGHETDSISLYIKIEDRNGSEEAFVQDSINNWKKYSN